MNKLKSFFGLFLGAATCLGAAMVAFSANKAAKTAKADGDHWYLRGTFNDWDGTGYELVDGGDPIIIDLSYSDGDHFLVVDKATSWDEAHKKTTGSGDATEAWVEYSSGNWSPYIKFTENNDTYVYKNGKYAISLKNGNLYVDFGEFFYSGSDNSYGITTDSDHPSITVNGGASQFNFTKGEDFKLRGQNHNWNYGVFGYSNLANGDFYGSFYAKEDGNAVCNIAGSYDISVALTNRTWTVRAVPHGANPDDTSYVYVLDKYGDKLDTYHQAHFYNSNGQETSWPGATMSLYEGTSHMYQQIYWAGMENVIFNNKHGTDNSEGIESISYDLSQVSGKCLILDNSTNGGKWSSNTWVEPETAKFIENCMHFANHPETYRGTGECVSEGWYTTAKNAYQASSFAPYRQELCTLSYVVERLQAWAAANGDNFIVTNSVGSFSANRSINILTINNGNGAAPILVSVIAVISLTAIGGYYFLKKGKKEKENTK